MTTAAPEELIIGGRYRVIRELGRGGMGSVYEAENLRTRRRVALKTMRPEVSSRAEFVRRFEREAQAGGRLRHPNVIDVLDLERDARTAPSPHGPTSLPIGASGRGGPRNSDRNTNSV